MPGTNLGAGKTTQTGMGTCSSEPLNLVYETDAYTKNLHTREYD